MKAVVVHKLHDRDAVQVSDMPDPAAGAGEVVDDVAAASVNFPDILMMDGKYQYRPDPPFVLGKDGAGTVSAVGDGVDGWAVGDRAMFYTAAGTFAEQAVAAVEHVYKVPDGLSLEAAAAMGLVYPTAWCALVWRGSIQPGDSVMVTGAAGGVGLATIDVAKALGAGPVLAAVSKPEKGEAARAAGADHVIDTSDLSHKDALRDQVFAVTDGKGVDLCVDVVGGDVFDAAIRSLAWGGRILVVGFADGRIPQIGTNYTLLKNIAVIGSPVSQYYDRRPDLIQQAQAELFAMAAAGKLHPHVMGAWPLADFKEALAVVEQRRAIGKVLLTV